MSTLEDHVRLHTKLKWHMANTFDFPQPFKHKITFYRGNNQAILATTIVAHAISGHFIVVPQEGSDGLCDVAIAQHPTSQLDVQEHYCALVTQVHETLFFKKPPWTMRWWLSDRSHQRFSAELHRSGPRSYSSVRFFELAGLPGPLEATLKDIFESEKRHGG